MFRRKVNYNIHAKDFYHLRLIYYRLFIFRLLVFACTGNAASIKSGGSTRIRVTRINLAE